MINSQTNELAVSEGCCLDKIIIDLFLSVFYILACDLVVVLELLNSP